MCAVFCDLAKVFDSVNHELLLYKLEYYGIQRKILDWFKSYLINRKQRVVSKSSNTLFLSSNWEKVKHWVPQASVLSFLIYYIHDLPSQINSPAEIIMFADDTSTLVSCNNYAELKSMLNSVLLHISTWFWANYLTLNVEKTNIIRFTPTKLIRYPLK